MDKAYDPKKVEKEIYSEWMLHHLFAPRKGVKKTFTMMLPPPNVTGNLHMGHALTVAIEDTLSRFRRMKGERVLWLPGFDHAGIATQVVVERELKKKGINRRQLGREAFTEEVWKWVKEYKKNIENQLTSMGSSLDWSRARFTLDEEYQDAVKEAFLHLYKKGLIYRGERMINWCARCQTVLSDLEVEYREEETKLYYIVYGPFVLATVRPETKLGDTALAVHPNDKRYKKYAGKTIKAKSVDGEISLRVIADEAVDMAFGTGVIKVTPAHDPVDFEIAKRHKLEIRRVIGPDNKMNENAGVYKGLTIEEARMRIAEDLRKMGLIEKIEDYRHRRGYCSRCATPIEPQVSLQWFISTKPLAKPIIKAAKEGKIIFVPGRFKKIFFQWMENIQDWCISRQLWWGHQLPVFYCSKKQEEFKINDYIVAKEKPNECPFCKNCSMIQDSDVLDTWFSSGLWPFATLGWPEKTSDFKAFYPNDVLETGYDILFFWVARMLMLGKELTGSLPFHTVYLHGLVRDKEGRKMSKSLGNVIEPLGLAEQYGTDALRFALLYGNSPGNDMRFDPSHLVGGRNFANKLWNISRFYKIKSEAHHVLLTTYNKEIVGSDDIDRDFLRKLELLKKSATRHLNHYRLAQALQEIHNFVWHEFADKYLEHVKLSEGKDKLSIVYNSLFIILTLLHPFMPFLTEALWKELGMNEKEGFLIDHSWI